MKRHKIDDFLIKNQSLYADEEKIHYEETKTNLENAWEVLSEVNILNIENEQKEFQNDKIVLNTLQQVKIELQTGLETFKLIDENVLKLVSVKPEPRKILLNENPNTFLSFKNKSLNDSIEILKDQIEVLENAIIKERRVYGKLKDHNIFIIDGILKIWIDKTYFLVLNDDEDLVCLEDFKPMGLKLTLKYKDLVFSSVFYDKHFKKNNDDIFLNLNSYIKEKEIVGEYLRNDISINIEQEEAKCKEFKNDLSSKKIKFSEFLVEAFLNKISEDKIFEYCLIYISNIAVKDFIKGIGLKYHDFTKINFGTNKMIDGLTDTYFLSHEDKNIKVIRSVNDFKIKYNGKLVRPAITEKKI